MFQLKNIKLGQDILKQSRLIFALVALFIFISYPNYAKQYDSLPKPCKKYFTLNIKSYSRSEWVNGFELYKTLKQKGYVVYRYFSHQENQGYLLKVQVGLFNKKSDAQKYIRYFYRTEKLNTCLDSLEVYVTEFKNQFKIFTTPNSIWLSKKNIFEEIYSADSLFYNNEFDARSTQPKISPDGKEIVFYCCGSIIKVNLHTKKAFNLVNEQQITYLIDSNPKWSPSGKYIAFLDGNEWEYPAKLWIMKNDGSDLCCLVKCEKENGVKSFQWHPAKDFIYYVEGYAYGTVSAGGNIYMTDLFSNRKLIAGQNLEMRTEVYVMFFIKGNFLYYKIAHHDEEYMYKHFTEHKIKIE